MQDSNLLKPLALACGVLMLAGCGISREVNRELDQATQELETGNLHLASTEKAMPAAEITPYDDFRIDGKDVPLTDGQRSDLRTYRLQIIDIARDGIEIGRQGAEVGLHAVWPMATKALFGASDESIERSMKKKLAPVQAAAEKLCDRLPELMQAEQQLATSLPAFSPYAKLTPDDVRDCRAEVLDGFDLARN